MNKFGTIGLVASLGAASAASAGGFSLLDDFNSYDAGLTTVVTGGLWHAEFSDAGGDPGDHTANSQIVSSRGGGALWAAGGAAWRGAERDLTGTGASVAVGETKTLFWQVNVSSSLTGSDWVYDFMMGLSPSVDNIDIDNAWQDFSVMPFINNAPDTPYLNAEAPDTPWWAPMQAGEWTNVWVVVNNDATAPSFDLYMGSESGDQILVAQGANWRNFDAGLDLNAIGFMAAGAEGTEYMVDNIYWADGVDLSNPVPAPGAVALLGLGGLVGARRRR